MKIPVRQQQTVLGSTQTAQARVPGPVAPAYSAAESRALAAAGQQMQQTGEVLFRLNEQQKKLNLAHFEATTQQMYKEYMAGLSAANDYQNFGQKYDDFEKSIDELGKSSLGEGEYDIWRQNAGDLFFRGAQLGTAQETAAKKGVQMQGELAKTLNQYATLASQANTPEAFEIYRQQADLALQEAYAPQDGSMPYINQAQRDKMADDFTRQVGTATLMQDMQSDPDKALSNLQNPKMYSFFTPVERQKWIEDARKVKQTQTEQLKKGWDLQQSQVYAMAKAKEMVGLQMRLEEFKRMEEAGEEIPAFSVFSQMQLLNDLATKPFQQGPDGRVSYILDPAKGEYYEEVKKLIPYMSRVIDDIRRDDAKSSSNFGYGLGLVSRMVEQDGTLNDRDISDMLKMYYDNMMKEFNNDSMAVLAPRDIGGNQKILKAFRDAAITFYGRRGQTLPDGINFYSVPGSMGVRVYNGDVLHLPENSYAQGTGAFVQSQKAHFQNPYVYAMGTGQYNARREEK